MGLFRTGFLALLVASTTLAQQPNPVPGGAAPAPGVPDATAPAPAIPQPEPTPGVDPNAIQPAPIGADTNAAPAAAAKPKPKKPAAPALPTLRGTVGAIDKNAMTITVHGKSKDETLNVTSKTRVFADNKPAILADAKEGENVVAEYRNTKEKTKEALTLRFGGAGGPAHAVSAPKEGEPKAEAKPAAKKPAKATAKKKKKAPANGNAAPAPGTETPGVTPLPESVPPPQPGTPAPVPGTPGTNP